MALHISSIFHKFGCFRSPGLIQTLRTIQTLSKPCQNSFKSLATPLNAILHPCRLFYPADRKTQTAFVSAAVPTAIHSHDSQLGATTYKRYCNSSQPTLTRTMRVHTHEIYASSMSALSGSSSAGLADIVGDPVAALVEPGRCVLDKEWTTCKLLSKQMVSHDSLLLTFALPNPESALNLSTCASILARFHPGGEGTGEAVVRPYTPISTNAMKGQFQLLVKVYRGGKMTSHMKALPVGSSLEFFHHPDKNVKIQYPFSHKRRIGMLVGGSGITPMLQALHGILGSTPANETRVSLLYGSKTQADILGKEILGAWQHKFPSRLSVTHVLSEEVTSSDWKGARGWITKEQIQEEFPAPSEDCMIFVCGPPPLYDVFSGPREEKQVSGVLKELGYTSEQVYKF